MVLLAVDPGAESGRVVAGKHLATIHITGGGSESELLDRFAADATGRTVVTGPVEAPALGSDMVQAIATGYLGSMVEGRQVIRQSFDVKTFEPSDSAAWEAAFERYLRIRKG